jgi:hypothetical protein
MNNGDRLCGHVIVKNQTEDKVAHIFHIYHCDCISEWFKNNHICPSCHAEVGNCREFTVEDPHLDEAANFFDLQAPPAPPEADSSSVEVAAPDHLRFNHEVYTRFQADLTEAIDRNDAPRAQQLLATGLTEACAGSWFYSEALRSNALLLAIEHDNLDIVQAVLNNGQLPDHSLSAAINEAIRDARCNGLEIVRQLLSKGPIEDTSKREAFELAQLWQRQDIANLLQ